MTRKSAKLALVVVVAVAMASILAAYAVPRLRSFADKRVEAAVGSLQDTVYSITGLRLGYGYAVLSSSNRIAIHEIELFQETIDDYSVLRRKVISIGDLDIRIDLWAAIFGKSQEIIKQVSLTGLAVDLELPADLAIYDRITEYLAGQPAGALPHLSIDIANASIAINDGARGRYSSSISSLQFSTISGSMDIISPSMLFFASLPSMETQELFLQVSMLKSSLSADFNDISASAGLSGRFGGLSISEQPVEVHKVGAALEGLLKNGRGLDGMVRYELTGGALSGDVKLAGYEPGGDVSGLEGIWKELGGLKYSGGVKFGYGKGKLGYEGSVKVEGGAGQTVQGLSVEGATLEVSGVGDEKGMSQMRVKGVVGGYEVGYEGTMGYEGMSVGGVVSLAMGGEGVKGSVGGGKGKYEVAIGEGVVRGVGIKGLKAGVEEKGERYDVKVSGEIGGGKVSGEGSILKGKKGYEWGMDLQGMEMVGLLRVAEGFGVKVPDLGVEKALLSGTMTVRGDYEKVSWVIGGMEGDITTGSGTVKVKGSGVGDGKRYEVKGLEVGIGKEVVSVKGSGEYGKGVTFGGEVGYRGMKYGITGTYGDGVVKVTGGYGLDGEVTIAGGEYRGSLKAEGLPMAVAGGVVYGDVSAVFGYRKDKSWWVEGEKVGVRYEGEGEYPVVGMKGVKASEGKVEVGELTVRGKGYGLAGSLKGSYKGSGFEGSGSFVGEEKLGGGVARYEVSLGYGSGSGRVKVGVKGYDLGLVGMKGYQANAMLEGSGDLSIDELLGGEYGKLDSWVMKGQAGLSGGAWKLGEQAIEVHKVGAALEGLLKNGRGLDGMVRYELTGGALSGDVKLAGYEPGGDVSGLEGIWKELGGLKYSGGVKFGYGKGKLGYEGSVKVEGGAGQTVQGLSVEGATLEVSGVGDEKGMSQMRVKGVVGGYEVGYEGTMGYEGMSVGGVVSLAMGGEGVKGSVGRGKGEVRGSDRGRGGEGSRDKGTEGRGGGEGRAVRCEGERGDRRGEGQWGREYSEGEEGIRMGDGSAGDGDGGVAEGGGRVWGEGAGSGGGEGAVERDYDGEGRLREGIVGDRGDGRGYHDGERDGQGKGFWGRGREAVRGKRVGSGDRERGRECKGERGVWEGSDVWGRGRV